jgi:hypothetical protein
MGTEADGVQVDPRARCPTSLHQVRRVWTLYWPDRNSRFHEYDLARPTADVVALLSEINRDPTSIFWG